MKKVPDVDEGLALFIFLSWLASISLSVSAIVLFFLGWPAQTVSGTATAGAFASLMVWVGFGIHFLESDK